MQSVQEIEEAVTNLSKVELDNFRDWFYEFDQAVWDRQFEKDAGSGIFDVLADQAVSDFEAGRCREI